MTSLDRASDGLQAFIAAWSALEIFVNATFKDSYEKRKFKIMEDGAPTSTKPVSGLADKFHVIASVLDPAGAADDTEGFRHLKKFRDRLFHALDAPSSALPTDAVQKLLVKYMKLHLREPSVM